MFQNGVLFYLTYIVTQKKAIKRSNKVGKILIKAYKDEEKVYLEFQDNGDGIPAENRDKIFTAI